MASSDYKELRRTIATLRKHLLPRNFDPTGDYLDRVFTGVVSFRVLCHAAIEEFLEVRATSVAIKSSNAAKSGVISHTTACLLSFSDSHFGHPPDTLEAPDEKRKGAWPEKIDIRVRANLICSKYIAHVKVENHGIRERNILKLLLPIGFEVSSLDRVLLTELDSFGQLRGQYAHTSAAKHIKSRPDPKGELDRVNKIVELLLGIDKEIDRLAKLIP